LDRFDDFYGSDNFDGRRNRQVIVEREVEVCRREQIEIVQQRLVILQEMARRVITEFVCDVETQVIVFEQFHRNNRRFRDDLRRYDGRRSGYDREISKHFSRMVDSNDKLTVDDLGFNGFAVGNNTVVFGGTNWNDQSSPASVQNAINAAGNSSAPADS